MIGAVLHTINVRLSPEQILYTIDHAEDDVLLVNSEFLPILEQIRGRINTVKSLSSSMTNRRRRPPHCLCRGIRGAACQGCRRVRLSPISTKTSAPPPSTPPAPPVCPKGSISAIGSWCCIPSGLWRPRFAAGQGGFTRHDVYMPITPMFHVHAWGVPYVATCSASSRFIRGATCRIRCWN